MIFQYSFAATVYNGFQISGSCSRLGNRRKILSGRCGYVSGNEPTVLNINTTSFNCLECTSSLSSFLTNLNGSVNVFIYFLKHRQFVIHLCHTDRPDTPRHQSPSPEAATQNRMITTVTQNRIITVTIRDQCYLVTSV
jgi:hypothetical protein